MAFELRGVVPALTTPFVGDDLAVERLHDNVQRYERHGLGGYLVLGSTAEAVLLDDAERSRILAAARRAIPAGKPPTGKPMIAGVHAESTAGALRQVRQAEDVGADAALVLTPHYFRDLMTDDALVSHYRTLAEAASVPILLYNVPKFTGLSLSPEATGALAEHRNVVGMKESSGDLDYFRRVVDAVGGSFPLFGGHAGSLHDACTAGAAGAILAAAVVFPEPFIAIVDGAEGSEELQRDIRPHVERLMRAGVPGIKAAMDVRGLHGGPVRRPLQDADPATRDEIEQVVDRMVERCGISREL